MDDKRCKRCGETKSLDEFYGNPSGRDGSRPECKVCTRAEKARRHAANPEPTRERVRRWQEANPERVAAKHAEYAADGRKALSNRKSYLKRKYGITIEQYDAMLFAQDGVCGICGREPHPTISLHVDHDHETGALRGLLCFRCNQAIGSLGEDSTLLQAASAYLDAHDPSVERYRTLTLARVAALPRPVWG